MNKTKKIITMVLLVFGAMLTLVNTVSAAKLGDPYSWAGVQIGWVFVIAAVIVGLALWYFLKSAPFKKSLVPLAIIVAFGLILSLTDVAVEITPAEVTPGVSWSVTASEQQGGNLTIDNTDNKIIIMCHVNSTAGTILDDDDTAFTIPILNFTINPTVTEGLTDLDLGATTLGSVVSPDAAFTVSGTSYDLFSDVTGVSSDKDLMWTADGTDEYEYHYCTVQFGTSEVAELEVNYNPAGVSQLDVGTIKSTSITIGGQTYTMTLIITGIIT